MRLERSKVETTTATVAETAALVTKAARATKRAPVTKAALVTKAVRVTKPALGPKAVRVTKAGRLTGAPRPPKVAPETKPTVRKAKAQTKLPAIMLASPANKAANPVFGVYALSHPPI